MEKSERKLSKVVVFGVTTHTMCFNCYGQQSGRKIPYQRLTNRRKAFRVRGQKGFLFRYRFDKHDKNTSLFWKFQDKLDKLLKALSMFFNKSFNFFFFFSISWRKSGDSSSSRQIRNTPDWSDNAVSGDHLWVPTSVSGDCCYVGDSDCTVSI